MEKTATDLSKSFEMYMKQLHCAGEVRLQEADTYDKWGIEISVRFREGEKLSVLTATQQSGGERAVSTIMYLMALQSMVQTPFRVVALSVPSFQLGANRSSSHALTRKTPPGPHRRDQPGHGRGQRAVGFRACCEEQHGC